MRRAFLCGHAAASGSNFDHRRGWIETRIRELASVFTIDVAAYAVMSNHYHAVLRVDAARAQALSDDEVLRRWKPTRCRVSARVSAGALPLLIGL